MISDKQIRSLIWTQVQEQNVQGQDGGENVLDLSHQQLRKLKSFQIKDLNVTKINASYNFFKDMGSLNFKEFNQQSQHSIRWLDLSFNFITSIDQTSHNCYILSSLRYLNVSANQIESVDFSQLSLPLLQTLNLNSNRLKFFLHCPQNLKVLTINDNELASLAFTGGDQLNILTAKNNLIKNIGLYLTNLSVFDIQSNKVDDIQMVKEFLKSSQNLLVCNTRENPVCRNKQYRVSVFEYCPDISQIDDIFINPHIREGFKVLKAQEQLNQMLDKAYKKYEIKLIEKQKIKEELIKKIRDKEKLAQENYYKNIDQQRKQFQLLEKQAQKMVAKGKLNAPQEKDQLTTPLNNYLGQSVENVNKIEKSRKDSIQKKHLNQYLEYLNKRRPLSKNRKESQIKRTTTKNMLLKGSSPAEEKKLDFSKMKLFDERAIKILLQSYNIDLEKN